jgi:hypothetical protein
MAVRTRTVNAAKAVGGDAKVEDYLDSKGVTWEFASGVAPDDFDTEKSLRNQARFVPVDEDRVSLYAEAMRRGDKFPPVVAHKVRGKLVIADGNHRLMAAAKARKLLDVYDITGTDSQLLVQISYEANTKHGWPTSETERIQQALYLMDNGATIQTASAALMVPKNALSKASQKRSTDQRFREAGIAPLVVEKLAESVKWRLGMVNTDEGFVALTNLVAQAGLGVDDVFRLVTEINELRSSAKQVAWVQQQRDVYVDEIAASGGGVLTRQAKGPKSRLSMVVGIVNNLPEDVAEIVKNYQGPEREEHAKRLRSAARRLNDVAKQLAAT